MFRGQSFEQRVRMLGEANLERPVAEVLPRPVEDEHSASTLLGDEARELVRQLARVLEPAGVQEVEAVEEVESRLRHVCLPPSCLRAS